MRASNAGPVAAEKLVSKWLADTGTVPKRIGDAVPRRTHSTMTALSAPSPTVVPATVNEPCGEASCTVDPLAGDVIFVADTDADANPPGHGSAPTSPSATQHHRPRIRLTGNI